MQQLRPGCGLLAPYHGSKHLVNVGHGRPKGQRVAGGQLLDREYAVAAEIRKVIVGIISVQDMRAGHRKNGLVTDHVTHVIAGTLVFDEGMVVSVQGDATKNRALYSEIMCWEDAILELPFISVMAFLQHARAAFVPGPGWHVLKNEHDF